jgi:hypothetical protein
MGGWGCRLTLPSQLEALLLQKGQGNPMPEVKSVTYLSPTGRVTKHIDPETNQTVAITLDPTVQQNSKKALTFSLGDQLGKVILKKGS